MRAMSLAANDGEGEQNEFRLLQSQLDVTHKLVSTLSQQLFELKDQVFYLKLTVHSIEMN